MGKWELKDLVLVNKGFLEIQAEYANVNFILVMLPILHNHKHSEEEILQTYIRVHIDSVC